MSSTHGKELRRFALTLLQPGFVGTTAPDRILREIRNGLASVVLLSRDIVSAGQVTRLTGQLRAENPQLIIAVDEESADVTGIESATGSTRPGNYAPGVPAPVDEQRPRRDHRGAPGRARRRDGPAGSDTARARICTHGASAASGIAAAELLAGAR